MAKPRTCHVTSSIERHLVPVASLTADPANLRVHGEPSIRAIMASYLRFGQQKPIVIDKNGVTVAGAGQLEAARRLGWTHIAAVRSDLAGVDRVGYAIADNRSAELSEWDERSLVETLGAMSPEDLDATGFTAQDLAELLDGGREVKEDAAPDRQQAATSRTGDTWHLGEHRLRCGDSTDKEDVHQLLAGHKADLVATDPPYLVDYTGVRIGDRGKDWSGVYREVEIDNAGQFFRDVFAAAVSVVNPSAAFYCWHAHKRIREILDAWNELGILDHQQVIWVKPVPVLGSVFWHFRHEPCLMGWVQGSKPLHDGRHDENSVWVAPGNQKTLEQLTKTQLVQLVKDMSSVWEVDWNGKARPVGNEHPTQKPVELFARPIRKHTAPGAVIYEPFSGSGTQIIAAEQLGRRCCAMELEPTFVDVAVRRWQALTGRHATLGPGGPTFEQVAKDRACPPDPSDCAPTRGAETSPVEGTARGTKPSTSPKRGGRPRRRRTPAGTAPSGGNSEE